MRFFHNQEQINGGKNNMFAAMSDVGGWSKGYYDGSRFKLWQWAKDYTLVDNFFAGAFGGSYLNRQLKKGHIDSTAYDTTSILKMVTRRFGLEPLPGVRANVGDLSAALE
jgi:phospholipase C